MGTLAKWGLALILLLPGCSGGGGATSTALSAPELTALPDALLQAPEPADSPPSRPYVLGFSQLGSESAWREANTASIVEAAREAGITLRMSNAEQSQKKQFDAIRDFIRSDVDIIAIAPVVQTGWEPILQEVKQAGIPVIILDRSVNVQDSSLYITFIGSDFYDEGAKAAKYVLDKMRHVPGTIRIAELQGTVGSTPSIDRGRGFRETIKDHPGYVITQSQSANFTQAEGKAVMREFLSVAKEKWPQVLYAHNDDMAIGALEAIEEAGLKPGADIVIVSVDGTRRAFEQMITGRINAVVECNPLLGPLLMQATKEIMAGRTLPKRMVPPEDIFTEELAAAEVKHRQY
ncbi:ABC transporter substrate-binding protein [Paenibacillus sp. NFR01]|uniref:ABC transporter substrate-binding protein n=1 Tax=Paenibacillus sp. NFR01 TaxID=1566279 RepID=UPI0008AD6403|nr:ABC transporter substrate-binding protein [Paenibacillus sp. NFR01]SET91550.1 simple sugar transport system substrate-binding protein [Paenibacillus sp. NFR01]